MSKVVLRIGYDDYVMEADVGIMIAKALLDAERFERKGYGDTATFHVWDGGDRKSLTAEFIPDAVYRVGKAAGQPEKA